MADTKTISIYDVEFTVAQPYAEGHTLTAAEAKQLNQVRAENIANNFRKQVKEAIDPETELSLDQVQRDFAEYESAYEFTLATVGSRRSTMSPLERETTKIARSELNKWLKENGVEKPSDWKKENEEKYAANLEIFMANDEVVKAAKAAVKSQEKIAEATAGLSL